MDKYIYEKENVISKEVCEEMIELFNSMPNKGYGTTAGGVRRNIKKTMIIIFLPKVKKKE